MLSIDVTIFLHAANFLLLYFMFKYFLSSKIVKAIDERRAAINSQITVATKNREEAERLKKQISEELLEAKKERKAILDKAILEQHNLKKAVLEEAKNTKKAIIDDAKREINVMKQWFLH